MSNRNKEQKSVEGHYQTVIGGMGHPYKFTYELPFSLKDKVFQIELKTIGRLWVWEEDGPETEYDWSQNGIDSDCDDPDFDDPDVLEVRFVESKVSTDV
jgi:hypothetical protein